jgi:GDSL-like Lipase/Acylhydrolase
MQYELSGYSADQNYQYKGGPFLSLPPLSTVYAVWIGTNDIGAGGFITNNEVPGKTIQDYVDCVFGVFDNLYQKGARRFVLMNLVPLYLSPMYAPADKGGVNYSQFWQPGPKPSNLTEISIKMRKMVLNANDGFKSRTVATAQNKQTYPDAQIALFDVWSLVSHLLSSSENTDWQVQ